MTFVRRLLCAMLLCVARAGAAQSIRIQVVDVGQGDGILIRTPHQQWVLIDAGPTSLLADSLGPYFGVTRLSLLFLSHRHGDHYAGMEQIIRSIPVDRFAGNLADCPERTTDNAIRAALRDRQVPAQSLGTDTLVVDSVRFIILPADPVNDPCPAEENNNSMVIRLDYGNFSMLFPGDAETEERAWLVSHERPLLGAAVLKAAHHGSDNGTSADWLEAVAPRAVIISAGVVARYGHPMAEAVDAYVTATNGRVFCTNRNGTIRVYGYLDGHFTISKQRSSTKSCTYDGT